MRSPKRRSPDMKLSNLLATMTAGLLLCSGAWAAAPVPWRIEASQNRALSRLKRLEERRDNLRAKTAKVASRVGIGEHLAELEGRLNRVEAAIPDAKQLADLWSSLHLVDLASDSF